MKKILKNIWLMLAIGLVAGIIIGKYIGEPSADKATTKLQTKQITKTQIWTCSMHPQIQRDGPGKCPICAMDLIPVDNSINSEQALPDEVQMSASSMKLAEIQTYIAKKEKPEKVIRLLGRVKADERLMFSQAIHFPGRIEKLYINFTGEKINKGQKLATVFSTELVTAQMELFEALKDKSTSPILLEATRSKLRQWKFTNQQIAELEKSGQVQTKVDILSDYSGFVIKRLVAEGDYLNEGQNLFEITDLSKVWVLFEAYENDLPWIKIGNQLDIILKPISGKVIKGKVAFIDPFLDATTRVAYVRVELPNPNGQLKPDMFATGIINAKLPINRDVILAPKSAVLWTGKRSIVYVKMPNRNFDSFIYRQVDLGEEVGDFYIINAGLEVGEEIATNGVFKIDASAQLEDKKSMMNAGEKTVSTGNNHNGGTEEIKSKIVIDKSKISTVFKKQLGKVVNNYLSMKNKLVNDNSGIIMDVKAIQKSLNEVDISLVKEDAHIEWLKALKLLNKDLKLISNSTKIDEQRKIFLTVSKSLSDVVIILGVEMEGNPTLYLDFCPMASDSGGYWLSSDKDIRNPYFGASMLKCGEVKQEIK